MKRTSWSERLNMAVNVLVIAFILFVLFRPDGLAMNELRKLRKGSLDREKISAAWPALAQGTRLVEGSPERVVVEFSDYQCPYCKQAHQVLDSVVREVGGTLVYRHMPLTLIHPEAEGAARAAICAERQGRFREMHDHRMRRLLAAGFNPDQAEEISELHTPNFM